MSKVLYFEGAGWSGADISKATVGNCRIRAAFHLDNGKAVYLEIIACERSAKGKQPYYEGFVDSCHYITGSAEDCNRSRLRPRYRTFEYNHAEILRFVNSLGCSFDAIEVAPVLGGYRVFKERFGYGLSDYNFGDAFVLDRNLLEAREAVEASIHEKEIARGEKYPCYSLWVDEQDPAILHYKNFRTREEFDICVDVPADPDKLPVLNKANAITGCWYAFAGGAAQLLRIYRISEEYAERYQLMYLDRCEAGGVDAALPGSDLAQWVIDKRKEGK